MNNGIKHVHDLIKEWTISANIGTIKSADIYNYIKELVDNNGHNTRTSMSFDTMVQLISDFNINTEYRTDIKVFDNHLHAQLQNKLNLLDIKYDNIDPNVKHLININSYTNKVGIWYDSKNTKNVDLSYRIVINIGDGSVPFMLDIFIS